MSETNNALESNKAAKKVKKSKNFSKKVKKFFSDIKGEFKKVSWPSRKQIVNNTAIVIVICVVASLFIFGIDTLFSFLVNWFLEA